MISSNAVSGKIPDCRQSLRKVLVTNPGTIGASQLLLGGIGRLCQTIFGPFRNRRVYCGLPQTRRRKLQNQLAQVLQIESFVFTEGASKWQFGVAWIRTNRRSPMNSLYDPGFNIGCGANHGQTGGKAGKGCASAYQTLF
jgi:hypothetical protein